MTTAVGATPRPLTGFRTLPLFGQAYVGGVTVAGFATLLAFLPRSFPQPWLFLGLVLWTCLTSLWKVPLPVGKITGSTLSVSYAANLMTLLLLGPEHAVVSAVAGAWTQCWYRTSEPAPMHRTLFSMAVTAITMAMTGLVYNALGGEVAPTGVMMIARPLVGAIGVYFLVNTGLVAGAVAMATRRGLVQTWQQDFLWSGASFMVAGTAGAVAASVIARGELWKAALVAAPVYFAYRTYEVFVGRLAEKERLAETVAEMTRLQTLRDELLEREQVARAHAEAANQIKDQFLAIVSHELRTPLTAILGWSDMLCRRVLEGEARDRATHTIFQSAKRQAQLIDDLLDVARISAGKLRLERTALDLVDPLQDALRVVQPGAEAKGVQLVLDLAADGAPVYGDVARLQQIAWNLLSNAVKFTPPAGVVRVTLRRSGAWVEVIVADTGQGIASDFLPRVFDAFRQADASTTRAQPGLGLGLSIVRSLVEAHGGSITVQSDGVGQGATFAAMFPLRVVTPAAEGDHCAFPQVDTTSTLDGVSVLVVDDDESTREVIAAHLQCAQAQVRTAPSAALALDVLRAEPIDVLLADVGMPGEDGYSLIRRVRCGEVPAATSVPAGALTAFTRDEDRRRALAAGFQLHLPKPVEPQVLVAAVANLHRRYHRACSAAAP